MPALPPWLDVSPGLFVGAAEAGNRNALERQNQMQAAQQAGMERQQQAAALAAQQKLAQQKLDQTTAENAADRALQIGMEKSKEGIETKKLAQEAAESAAEIASREKISGQQQNFELKKFQSGLDLDQAAQRLNQSKFDFEKAQKEHVATNLAAAKKAAADILGSFDPNKPIGPLLSTHPEAAQDKDFMSFAKSHDTQLAIRDRQMEAAKAKQQGGLKRTATVHGGKIMEEKITGGVDDPGWQALEKNSTKSSEKYSSVVDVKKAYDDGTLTRDEAKKI